MAVTLNITADISTLTKSLHQFDRQTATLGEKLSKSLSKGIEESTKGFNAFTAKLKDDIAKGAIPLPKFQKDLNILQDKIKLATTTKLKLDTQEAFKSIVDMKYQILGVGAALLTTFGKPLGIAREFESSFSNIKKVVDFDSDSELKNFQNQIWNLTKSIPLAAKDLTDIVASGGQLGLKKNLLIPFTTTVAKMSTAFDLGTKEAGDNIAKLMNNFDIGLDKVTELGDAINYISNKTAAAPKEIVDILGRIAGTSKALGATSLQATALSTAFANMKVPSDQAGTAINKMFTTLGALSSGNVTGSVSSALKTLGLSVSDVSEAMASNPFETIKSVLKSISTLDQSQQIGVLKNLFGEEAAPKIALITSNVESLDKIVKELGNKSNYTGSMQKEFEAVSATTNNSLQLMRNSFARLGNAIGTVFLPVVNMFAKTVALITNSFAAFLEISPIARYAVVGLGIAFAGFKIYAISAKLASFALTSALHPLRFILVKILPASFIASNGINLLSKETYKAATNALAYNTVLPLLSKGIRSFGKGALWAINPLNYFKLAIKAVTGGINIMTFALLKNPIGLIATGIAVVAGAIIYWWKPISTFFSGFFKGFSEAFKPMMPLLKGIGDMVKVVFTPISFIFNALFGNMQSATGALKDFSSTGERIGKAVGDVFSKLFSFISGIINKISGFFNDTSNFIASIGDKLGLSTTVKLSQIKAPPKAEELQSLAVKSSSASNTTNSNVTNANTITIVTNADPKEVVRAVATYSD
ncbi:phage tail tape measure protein [Helicobacter sp. 11S02629-2]|uniref:phage tail tape measure protein n=1 Tax=Helicobacter sp. 11S02629-2 TaxID=1476195 RepID=UPI000BA5F6F3|nr:phage tail tape measure protein [Helicobacter sp. 11S02629-2]PAF44158.1 phage tail tape measure protein [Helicobacter sp. 11S02629-2]